MELVLEIQNTCQTMPHEARQHVFDERGGVIGRSDDCDWRIPDVDKHLSGKHAHITFKQGAFYLTDTSSNGTYTGTGAQLTKHEAFRVVSGARFRMSGFEIMARLRRPSGEVEPFGARSTSMTEIIPDDFDLLDPLQVTHRHTQKVAAGDTLAALLQPVEEARQRADHARIDMEHLPLPKLVAPRPQSPTSTDSPQEVPSTSFWKQFGAALGIQLDGLDPAACEALAIKAAHLLAQSVGDLQQCLRTRSELKDQLRLQRTNLGVASRNPLWANADSGMALAALLLPDGDGLVDGERVIARAFHDLQAHQLALLAASRAAIRATLEHFAPQQLQLRFERAGERSLFTTAGSRWRAYRRYHQALAQDDEFSERLLARDFAQAYDEQVRLVATLHCAHQG